MSNEQEVISRRDKHKSRKAVMLYYCVGEESQPVFQKVFEVKDRWLKVKVKMASGAAKHVMPEGMFSRVKLERQTAPKKSVAANGEQTHDLCEKAIPFKQIRRCTDASHLGVRALSNHSSQCRSQCRKLSDLDTL